MFFDDFVITEESRKVEVTPDGILIYANPDSYVKLDQTGLTIKTEDLQVQNLEANDLATMGNFDQKSQSVGTGGTTISGLSGDSGTSGTDGTSGVSGSSGTDGTDGTSGDSGSTGTDGTVDKWR